MTDDPVAAARRAGRSRLTEPETKRLLADAGVAVPDGEVVGSADEAAAAADRVGYPAVAKVVAPPVVHASDWAGGRGVALDLGSADAVRSAAAAILDAAADRGVDAAVLVESAVESAGTEVVVGGSREPAFGPTVLVGAGGLLAEVYGDVAHRLAPLSRAEARRAVGELRTSPLLSGYRTRPAADVDALADVVVAVGDLLADRPALAEVDVNPVLAAPDGAVALDAAAVLAGGDAGGAPSDDSDGGGTGGAEAGRAGGVDGGRFDGADDGGDGGIGGGRFGEGDDGGADE